MKKAITIGTMGACGRDRESAFALVKKAGFDGIELSMDAGDVGCITLNTTEKELMDMKKLADDNGIEIPSVTGSSFFVYSLASENEESREMAMKLLKKQIDAAKIVGADSILFVPGIVDASLAGRDEVISYDVAYKRTVEGVKEVVPYAKAAGINLGIENVWNKFLISPLDMKNIIDDIGDDIVGCYFDVGNVMYTAYPEQWIRILGDRIKRVHVKDFKTPVGNIMGFVPLLAGNVNYPEVMKALNEIGYDKWITSEVSPSMYYPEYTIYATAMAMDYIIGNR